MGRKRLSAQGKEVLIIEGRLRLISAALLRFSRPPPSILADLKGRAMLRTIKILA